MSNTVKCSTLISCLIILYYKNIAEASRYTFSLSH